MFEDIVFFFFFKTGNPGLHEFVLTNIFKNIFFIIIPQSLSMSTGHSELIWMDECMTQMEMFY